MTYERPDSIWREFDTASNAAQHEVCKARVMLDSALRSLESGKVKGAVSSIEHARRRIDKAQAKLHPPMLTQWRQAHAVPKELRRQQSSGPPADLVCKKCGQERDRNDFFWDDGGGSYGFTMRCVQCRPAARKNKAPQPKPGRE